LVLRNTTLTEAELEPLRKSRNVEALLVGDRKSQIEYLLPGGFGKWQSGDASKEPTEKETSFSDEKDPDWQVNSPLNKHNLNTILSKRGKFTGSDLKELLGPETSIEAESEALPGWTLMAWEDVSRIEVTFRDKVVVKVSGTFSPRLKSQVINKEILGQLRTGMTYNDVYKNFFLGCKAEGRQDVESGTITHIFEQYNRFRVSLKDGKAMSVFQIEFQNRDGPPIKVP
jgi:hypothetical protein